MRAESGAPTSRQSLFGMSLVEVMIATAILAIITVGVTATFFTTRKLRQITSDRIQATAAVQSRAETILALRKSPIQMAQNIQAAGLGTAYDPSNHNSLDNLVYYYSQNQLRSFGVPDELGDATGTVTVYLNESTVPLEVGPTAATSFNANGDAFGAFDLNGDGDTSDSFTVLADNTYGIELLPIEINVSWTFEGEPLSVRRFMLLARLDS